MIPLSVPNMKGNELKYLEEAVCDEWVSTGGPHVNKFEKFFAEYVNAPYTVACQSGTAGLHLALKCLGIGKGQLVIVPALTFIAAVNPVTYVGAEPVFMDCDDSLCMDPVKLQQYLKENCDIVDGHAVERKSGLKVSAVVVVHVFGNMADMPSINKIAKEYGLFVIEDATEALGTKWLENGVHAGMQSDIGVSSFNGNKIITTGGGGMMMSSNKELIDRARFFSTQAKADDLFYIHDEVGYNYRMTNIQAAVGIAQLEQLESFIKTKTENWQLYNESFTDHPDFYMLGFRKGIRPNYWFYSLVFKNTEDVSGKRDELLYYLKEKGIVTRPIWGLINQQKPYRNCRSYNIEKALYYHKHILNLPCSTNLRRSDVMAVIEAINTFH